MKLRPMTRLLAAASLLAATLPAAAAFPAVSPDDAIHHVGEHAMVCGKVESANRALKREGEPTFLSLDHPASARVFIVRIWGRDRSNLPYAPESLNGQHICVKGLIKNLMGTPEIVVYHAFQISTH